MVTIGNVNPYNLLVDGSMLAGPTEPLQLPIIFEQITKYLSVSMGFLGPTIADHQPLVPET